jgi:hypothetical protein
MTVPSIPQPLKAEHDELHAELVQATRAGGRTGEAARAVASVLHPHFVKEEEYALPPLGLLARVARGENVSGPEAAAAIAMAERLKQELPRMIEEHGQIVVALDALVEAARAEGHAEHARFAEKLALHAKTEEEVLYPAAILLGDRLKAAAAATGSGGA